MVFKSFWLVLMVCGLIIVYGDEDYQKFGIGICYGYMFFISAFRGNFTTDYESYVRIFRHLSNVTFSDFLTPDFEIYNVEKGFGFLNYIISRFTRNEQVIFIITSYVIVYAFYRAATESVDPFLFTLVFLCFGPLFHSYNVMRQIVAVAFCLYAYNYIFTGNFKKFFLIICAASTFHISAMLMIPFYFILRIKLTFRSMLVQIVAAAGSFVFFDRIMATYDTLFFGGKYGHYEVTFSSSTKEVMVPAFFVLVVAVLTKTRNTFLDSEGENVYAKGLLGNTEEEIIRNSILYNGSIMWLMTFVLSLKMYYVYRYGPYFSYFTILAITYSINDIEPESVRKITRTIIIAMLSLYYLLFGQYFGNYVFCF